MKTNQKGNLWVSYPRLQLLNLPAFALTFQIKCWMLMLLIGGIATHLKSQNSNWDDRQFCHVYGIDDKCSACSQQNAPYADQLSKSLYAPATLWWKKDKRSLRKHPASVQNDIAVNLEQRQNQSILVRTKSILASDYLASVDDDVSFMAYPAIPIRVELRNKKGQLIKSERLHTPGDPCQLDCRGLKYGRYSIRVYDERDDSMISAHKFWVWGNPNHHGW